ncbi:ATP-binding protein [uncultured Porticoccus sp.]|uniref:two-component system sensor histidine kinase NtrB n=1 Tax=uncultured Porticoccus sp. TaxID=1256050 RepID=UPI0026324665|nr:ATP-binding protein [uncultured Porticoccus sp.]
MKIYATALFFMLASCPATASIIPYFRLEDGHTNWQYVANWSSGIFIILLSITVVTLFFSRRQAHRANKALEVIRQELEQRVKERTATLDESNRLLQKANVLLQGEIVQHRETTSRLRSSEAYIKDVLSSMPLMLIGLTETGSITQWNRRAEEITGIPAAQAVTKNLWKTYPTITLSKDQVKKALNDKKPVTIKHSQRGQYHFDITIYPLRNQAETDAVILIDDVTQHILTSNMLIQRDKMSSMGELAATMAHDINAPLQIILNDIQTAYRLLQTNREDSPWADDVTGVLEEADHQGQQALAVINNLLDFSKSRGGEKRLANITGLIEHTIELANDVLSVPSGLRFREITIERHYSRNLPDIPCYASELQQVFLSLFRHACHALGQVNKSGHTPIIRIQIIVCYDMLWIKVQHNGLGISYDEQQYIFEPFFTNKAGKSSAEDYDAGKRLSFSHFIITEQHKGQLAVTSDMNVGTTFHIQLPLA